jgi:aconitase A
LLQFKNIPINLNGIALKQRNPNATNLNTLDKRNETKVRIYLDVTPAVAAYAERHGAIYDKLDRRWYYEPYIPAELESFVPKQLRPKRPENEVAIQCLKCGCEMLLKVNKNTGIEFWSCSAYPRCKGSKST